VIKKSNFRRLKRTENNLSESDFPRPDGTNSDRDLDYELQIDHALEEAGPFPTKEQSDEIIDLLLKRIDDGMWVAIEMGGTAGGKENQPKPNVIEL